jgi:hypothetical protein
MADMWKGVNDLVALKADNAGLRAENAELRQRLEGMEDAVAALRILLERSQPPLPDPAPDPDEALRYSVPAGRA